MPHHLAQGNHLDPIGHDGVQKAIGVDASRLVLVEADITSKKANGNGVVSDAGT